MVEQGFYIGERDWWIMAFYDIKGEKDLGKVFTALLALGCDNAKAQQACMELSGWDAGYTFTNYSAHASIILIGKATSSEEAYDTIQHELKHVTEHISNYYNVDPKSEKAAYLQGEIGKRMFPAAAMVFCPKCKHEHR